MLALKRILRPRAGLSSAGKLTYSAPKVYDEGAIDTYLNEHNSTMMTPLPLRQYQRESSRYK